MTELLKLADAYYLVAADLKARGERTLETAETLNRVADQLCEANMREAGKVAPRVRCIKISTGNRCSLMDGHDGPCKFEPEVMPCGVSDIG